MNLLLLFGLALALFALGGKAVEVVDARARFCARLGPILRRLGLTEEATRLALAHAGIETVFGTKGSSQSWSTFNFWNITAGTYWTGPVLGGGDLDGSGAPITQSWRVYAEPEAAARDYLELLSLPRYRLALSALLNGRGEDFVRELRAAGYFTAPLADYWRAFQAARAQVDLLAPEAWY